MNVVGHDHKTVQRQAFILSAILKAGDDGIDVSGFDQYRQPVKHCDRAEIDECFICTVPRHLANLPEKDW